MRLNRRGGEFMYENIVEIVVGIVFFLLAIGIGVALYNALTRVDTTVMRTYELTGDLLEGMLQGPLPSERSFIFRHKLNEEKNGFSGTIFAFSGTTSTGGIPPSTSVNNAADVDFLLTRTLPSQHPGEIPSTTVQDGCGDKPCLCVSRKPIIVIGNDPSKKQQAVYDSYQAIKECRQLTIPNGYASVKLDFRLITSDHDLLDEGQYPTIKLRAERCASDAASVCVTSSYVVRNMNPA